MGYTALLFCPDEKTARTVTQVLSELEFAVEACIEPFAAVKKLMGQHFDAVVVDCDNEQNATLLFKSARNSTSNQTSLAVAVVEGQAGVAKAFRIGANLVLTKPINIEQTKGTLRVARGLLRKSEPAKPGTPATGAAAPATATMPAPSAAAAAVKPAVPKPPSAAKPAAAVPAKPATTSVPAAPIAPRSTQIPVAKPAQTQSWPAAAAASAKPNAQDPDDDLLDIGTPAKPAAAAPIAPAGASRILGATLKVENPLVSAGEAKPAFASSQSTISSGAASAPAPAREPQAAKIAAKSAESTAPALPDKATEAASSQSAAYVGAAPTFSFGAAAETEAKGGNKKIFIGVAAALAVAVVGYFGWTQLKSHSAATPTATAPFAVATPQASKPSVQPAPAPVMNAAPAPAATAPSSQPTEPLATRPAARDKDSDSEEPTTPIAPKPTKASNTASSAPSKTPAAGNPEPEPMVVKGGKVPATHTETPAADAPPPSMAGLATGATPPPDLVTGTTSEIAPRLQTLSISQGVSQGLLFKKVAPVYPQNAIRMRIEGAVELQATISKTGDISHIKVLSGDPQLTKAASDAVKQWKYKPYLLNGEPVEIQTQVTVNFRLPH